MNVMLFYWVVQDYYRCLLASKELWAQFYY